MCWGQIRQHDVISTTNQDDSLACLRRSKIRRVIQVNADAIATRNLVERYNRKLDTFDATQSLKLGVDPFRFAFNVTNLGTLRAIEEEIEHKLEMHLENCIGDFHEDYLGNITHAPSDSKWERIPQGEIPGIDIANRTLSIYL